LTRRNRREADTATDMQLVRGTRCLRCTFPRLPVLHGESPRADRPARR